MPQNSQDLDMLRGSVALVGAGPGDPELLTVRAWRLITMAEVVLCDNLVSPAIRDLIPSKARHIDVGKIPRGKATSQEVINALLIKEARSGHFVVRLKGGDPLVFGRGGEEALALTSAQIPCQVVPGISSCISVPALAGIPVTHRHLSTHFTVLTGMSAKSEQLELETRWRRAAALGGTLVFLMGVSALPRISRALREGGLAHDTPVAIVEQGARTGQRTTVSTLAEVAEVALARGVRAPAIIIVGEVVALREQLGLDSSALCEFASQFTPTATPARAAIG